MHKILKEPSTLEQQIEILGSRRILIKDKESAKEFLSRVNYYRLTGYMLPFIRKPSEACFVDVPFEKLTDIYNFDTELRNLIFMSIEEIEIYARTQIVNFHSLKYGAEGYMDAANFNTKHDHVSFDAHVSTCIRDNIKTPIVQHHIKNYGGRFPLWVISEFFSLGMLSHFYTDLKNADKTDLSISMYSVNYQTLSSWLKCLSDLRNRCAHYSRLYFWKFSAVPKIPKGSVFLSDRKLFTQLYMLKMLYPQKSRWNENFIKPLERLMKKYSDSIESTHIGFPCCWKPVLAC